MKSVFAVLALATCTFAQRLTILSPSPDDTLVSGQNFTAELQQENTLSSIEQVSVTISMTACYDVCDDPAQWGPATVLYDGSFDPQYDSSAPEKGFYQDIPISMPSWPAGESVISIFHRLALGASRIPSSDYSSVHVQVVTAK